MNTHEFTECNCREESTQRILNADDTPTIQQGKAMLCDVIFSYMYLELIPTATCS